MKTSYFLLLTVIVLVTAYSIFFEGCLRSDKINNKQADNSEFATIEVKIDTFYKTDTIFTSGQLTNSELSYVDSFFLPAASIDTAEILRKFYTSYTYSDSLIDSNIKINARLTVNRNRIDSFKLNYVFPMIKKETFINNDVVKTKYRSGFYIGAGFRSASTGKDAISPELLFISKKKSAVSIGYDLINKEYSARYYLKLF